MMHLYSAGRADHLAARLAEVLAAAPADPMAAEWVGVSSQAMRRWLQLELARHLGASGTRTGDGVAANFDLPLPGWLRIRVLQAGRVEDEPDPWEIERLVWSVLAVGDAAAGDPVLEGFNAVPDGASRYAKARRVADLFDRYHVHRPAMVRQWAANNDVGGLGWALPSHHLWQPHLWRAVRDHIGAESPPERWPGLLQQARDDSLDLHPALPERLSIFGLTSLPGGRSLLELAEALAPRREVHLFLLEPTHFRAVDLHGLPGLNSQGQRIRSEDASSTLAVHPLLRSWGRPHREASVLLADALGEAYGDIDLLEPSDDAPATVLGRLQHEIAVNSEASGSLAWDPSDRSVQLHACHGATRQVEVLRDVILHFLADADGTLVEDDIVVLCPDLEQFAPLIEAVFGPSTDSPAAHQGGPDAPGSPALRYRIADRSQGDTNPVLSAMSCLLELVDGRCDATTLLDFMSLGPVRHRFGLDEDDLDAISAWVERTQIRWGLDPLHRVRFGVPETITTNTWRSGLDRLLLGSAISDDEDDLAIGEVSVVGVEGGDTDTLGRLSELMWRVTRLVERCSVELPVSEWVSLLRTDASELFSVPSDQSWQVEALTGLVADLEANAAPMSDVPLRTVDIRRLFDGALSDIEGRPDFFRGGITVTSIKPLRGLPARVVCVLGADEAAFGAGQAEGDDLAAQTPLVGDPDKRTDDRQALLEAILSAADAVVVLRDGRDVRTNQPTPRAVAVEEFCEVVTATVRPADRAAFVEMLEVEQPRQAYDERCFTVGGLRPDARWSFDASDLAGARARRGPHSDAGATFAWPLVARHQPVVTLDALHEFLRGPVAWFVGRSLLARLPRRDQQLSTRLPVDPSGLDRWKLATGLLSVRMDGDSIDAWVRVERQRGTLPPATLGDGLLDELVEKVDQLLTTSAACGVLPGMANDVPVDIALPSGIQLTGTVRTNLPPPRSGSALITYSKAKSQNRVAAWLNLMALVANDPTTDWRAVVVNRTDAKKTPVTVTELVPAAEGDDRVPSALRALDVVVDLFQRGSEEPLPLFPAMSESVYSGKANPEQWRGDFGVPETSDPATDLVYGEYDFYDLMALPAKPDDPITMSGRVAAYAEYLYGEMERSATVKAIEVKAK
jgi:exodeoxyribonuclease V gamma subunit